MFSTLKDDLESGYAKQTVNGIILVCNVMIIWGLWLPDFRICDRYLRGMTQPRRCAENIPDADDKEVDNHSHFRCHSGVECPCLGVAMYVCLCEAVTDGQIRRAVGEGACSMRLLRERLGVAANCGRCAPFAKQVLDTVRAEGRPADLAPA